MANQNISHNEMIEIWFSGYQIHETQTGAFFITPLLKRNPVIYGGRSWREAYNICKQYAAEHPLHPTGGTVSDSSREEQTPSG